MELLKDSYADTTSDGRSRKIKEEIPISDEYNYLPGNDLPEEAPTSYKDASEEEREFTVTLDDSGKKHVVRGRLSDNVLTALKATNHVCAWMDGKETEEFYLIEKKKSDNICINLGMPLKYVPEGSQYEMKQYKLKEDEKTDELWYRQYDSREEECILFYVRGTGSRMGTCGAQTRRVIRCSKVLKAHCIFCVFAPKGESIRDAVCNDGRFVPLLKEMDWELTVGGETRQNNYLVDNLQGKVFEIEVQTKRGAKRRDGPNKKQNRLASSKGQPNVFKKPQQQPQDFEQGQPNVFKKPQQQPQDFEQGQANFFKKSQQQPQDFEQGQLIPFKERVLVLYPKLMELRQITDDFLKLLKKDDFEVYKRQFGKEVNDSLSVNMMRTLTSYSNSVGHIVSSSIAMDYGTCFVLSGRYILTCHHVVKLIVGAGIEEKDWGNRIKRLACVTFSHEDNHTKGNSYFFFENWFEISDEDLDFAILKLEENESPLPPGLLQLRFPLPQDGIIFIIGHPDGKIKSVDICLVISIFERSRKLKDRYEQGQKIECSNAVCGYLRESRCIHKFMPEDFERVRNDPNIVSYDTSFFWGSSGSPVFNKRGELVALHTGGFAYKMGNREDGLIEYGHSIHSILLKIESKFKTLYDAIIAPPPLTGSNARENSLHVNTSLNETQEKMDTS
ncbi:protein FAM111A-like [Python bivittatus]|uniref:Protein FAM111A-like n=1 Tax=Python bivittatus TaxID=176946 RepID=A0A9F2N6Q2_PYTBI|nr:protein FAM111A-like [Python bivittatus]